MSLNNQNLVNPFENKETSSAYFTVDEVYQCSARGVKQVLDPCSLGAEAIIVDLGAGTGVSSEVLKEGVNNFFVVEPSESMLEHAQKRLGDEVYYINKDAAHMFEAFNKDVDAIYALNCIHLFPDLLQAFAGVAASLKQGGKLVFNITAPSFMFENVSDQEKIVYQANVDFYKGLYKLVQNEIVKQTADLLQDALEQKSDKMFTFATINQFFSSLNFKYLQMQELDIAVNREFQYSIWRMMAKAFTNDESSVENIIKSVSLPEVTSIRQAIFVFENNN